MFGEGSYFAEDAGKSDHYTRGADKTYKHKSKQSLHQLHDVLYTSKDDHPGDVRYILMCRVRTHRLPVLRCNSTSQPSFEV